ncbi:MAG: radical SAM protein, partial [Lentisphaerae bacterium]|nr:radical SAM protein [Lentisphaerota bacterium]
KRLVDYLLTIDLDLAEFTILTPFPHTSIREQFEKEKRILHNDWPRYNAAQTVFRPAKMSVDALDKMHQYAWDAFYHDVSKESRMAKLYLKVIQKEKEDGTYRRIRLSASRGWHTVSHG